MKEEIVSKSIEEIVDFLKECDKYYFNNDSDSLIEDSEYDYIVRFLEKKDPNNEYLKTIGKSPISNKIKLPYRLGSLDQIHEGEIKKWIKNNNLNHETLCITDKLDGTSCLLVYGKDGNISNSYSRGDGTNGQPWGIHTNNILTVPKTVEDNIKAVRGEIIIPLDRWELMRTVAKSRSGREYKNPRNCVSGLMNVQEELPEEVYKNIEFVPYEIISFHDDTEISKEEQLLLLRKNNFIYVFNSLVFGEDVNDDLLSKYIKYRKDNSNYELDGIVIDINRYKTRSNMTRNGSSLNPKYAVKYKVLDEDAIKETKVIEVEWNTSKHGILKPRIKIEPVELSGVEVNYATGYNGKFIYDNKIGKNSIIKITRSGDVIPKVLEVVKETQPDMPDCEWEWNDSKVETVSLEEDQSEANMKMITETFESLDIGLLKQGNVKKLIEEKYDSFIDIVKMSKEELVNILGVNGEKIFNEFKKLNNIPYYKLFGATNIFGAGIGIRKLKKIQEIYDKSFLEISKDNLLEIEGIQEKTADKIIEKMDDAKSFIKQFESTNFSINYDILKQSDGKYSGQNICFTGFRNKELQKKVEDMGGIIKSSVTKNTNLVVTNNVDSSSSKIKKAKELGITIINNEDFEKEVNE